MLQVTTGIDVTGLNVVTGNIIGTLGSDVKSGTSAADTYFVTTGSDTYTSNLGGDTIIIGPDFFLEDVTVSGSSLTFTYEDIYNFNIHTTTITDHAETTGVATVQFDLDEDGTLETFNVHTGALDQNLSTSNVLVVGTTANEALVGGTGASVLVGGGGNDTLTSGVIANSAAYNVLDGGLGNDTLTGSISSDLFIVSDGDDVMNVASGGGDTLEIDHGYVIESAFRDSVSGNVTLGLLDDLDVAHSALVQGNTDAIGLSVEVDFDEDGIEETYLLAETANASTFTAGALVVGDDDGAATNLTGSGFDDVLIGDINGGDLSGGAGNDILAVATFADNVTNTIDGGTGANDTVSFLGITTGTGVLIDLNAVNDGNGTASDGTANLGDVLLNVENVVGSDLNDTISGDGLDNTLIGEFGDDSLTGEGGADTLTGGAGNDTFFYLSSTDSDSTNGIDIITDFDSNAADIFDISALMATGDGTNSATSFTFVLDGAAFTGGNDLGAEARLVDTTNANIKILELDMDADGLAETQIEMQNVDATNLDELDFVTSPPIS